MADALTLSGSAEHVRARIDAYRSAGLTGVMLNPSPPGGWFPLYEGHFPVDAELPPFDFPGFLGVSTTHSISSAHERPCEHVNCFNLSTIQGGRDEQKKRGR